MKPKWQHDNEQKRMKAIGKVKDQNQLARIALDPANPPDVRKYASARVMNVEIFFKELAGHIDDYTFEFVAKHFTPTVLAMYAAQTKNMVSQAFIVDFLSDEDALASIVSSRHIDWSIKSKALAKINDQTIVASLLGYIPSPQIQYVLPRISDQQAIQRYYDIAPNPEAKTRR